VVDTAGPVRKPWRNRLSIVATVLIALLLVVVGYSCLNKNDRSSYSAPVQRLTAAPAGVTYIPNGMLYIVAQPDSSVLALDEQDRIAANRLNGCIVRWRPDLENGVFQEDERCGGALFGRDGSPLSGGAGLLRHPVRLADKSAVVDIRHCMAPEDGAVRLCKDFRR
jgi:hypothetical protein